MEAGRTVVHADRGLAFTVFATANDEDAAGAGCAVIADDEPAAGADGS